MALERTACLNCDLPIEVGELRDGERADCPRCGSRVTGFRADGLERSLAFALAAMVLLALANAFPFLAFKGPVSAIDAYDGLSRRSFADLDILLRPEQMHEAAILLVDAGYRMQSEPEPAAEALRRRYQTATPFIREDGACEIDVHTALLPRTWSIAIDYDALWRRARTVGVNGVPVPTFSIEPRR